MGRVKLTDKKGRARGGRSGKGQSKKKQMRELTARSVLERELQGVSDAVNEKGGWTTMVCSATPNHSGDIFHAIYATDAELLPSTGMPELHALMALFDFRLSASSMQLYVLGKAPSDEKRSELLLAAAQLLEEVNAGDPPPTWASLLEGHGLCGAACALLLALLSLFRPCSGIAVDDGIAAVLESIEKSVWPTGEFRGRGGADVVAREECFPARAAAAACIDMSEVAPSRIVRTSACERLVGADDGVHTCDTCDAWKESLDRKARDGSAYELSLATSSRVPFATLAVAAPQALLHRTRKLRDELTKSKQALRIELEKRHTENVRLKGKVLPMDELFRVAEECRQEGALDDDPEAKALFEKDSLFRSLWMDQAKGLRTKRKEAKKLREAGSAAQPKGTGMRYHPIVARWALRLYNKGRAAYRETRAALPYLPCERCVLSTTHVFFMTYLALSYLACSFHDRNLTTTHHQCAACFYRRTLREYRRAAESVVGTNTELLLELQAFLTNGNADCVLAFDGMTIRDGIFYDRYSGDLIGMEDVGDLVTFTKHWQTAEREVQVAKECMQLIATSLDCRAQVLRRGLVRAALVAAAGRCYGRG